MGDRVSGPADQRVVIPPEICGDLRDVVTATGSPELAINVSHDFFWGECTDAPPASPSIDYYLRAFSDLKAKLLRTNGIDREKVSRKLDPAIALFRSAQEKRLGVLNGCVPSACTPPLRSAQGRSFPRADDKEVPPLFKKFGLESSSKLSALQQQVFMSKLDPASDVLVIFWPDIHHGVHIKGASLELAQDLMRTRAPGSEVFRAIELSEHPKPLPPKVRRQVAALAKGMRLIIQGIARRVRAEGAGLAAALIAVLEHPEVITLYAKIARLKYPTTPFQTVVQCGLLGEIGEILIRDAFPDAGARTWKVEDSALYQRQLEGTQRNNVFSFDLADVRSRASVGNLWRRIGEARKKARGGKVIVIVEQGLTHASVFLDELAKKPVNIVAIAPDGILPERR